LRVRVCSLSYPPCNAQAHIVMHPVCLYNTFFHIISYATRFSKKKSYRTQNVCFPLKFLSETFLVLRSERDLIINVNCYCRQILIKFEISRQIFENYSCNKFYQSLYSGIRFDSREWIGRWTGMKKLTVAFRKFAKSAQKLGYVVAVLCLWLFVSVVFATICVMFIKKKGKLRRITSRQQDRFSCKNIDTVLSKVQINLCYKYWNKNKLGKMNHIEIAAVSKQHNRVFWYDMIYLTAIG
jgi:hypothetical protein